MIIKGLFKRYERWNPVHPTAGAFWGMGVGVGCGVGWGPGFGPEVIGYVGAGCGVGFSVGITLAGFGIGLPANYFLEVPYKAVMATRSSALEFARSSGLLSVSNTTEKGWSNISSHISRLQRTVHGRFSSFNCKDTFNRKADLSNMKIAVSSHASSILDHMQKLGAHFGRPHRGLKD